MRRLRVGRGGLHAGHGLRPGARRRGVSASGQDLRHRGRRGGARPGAAGDVRHQAGRGPHARAARAVLRAHGLALRVPQGPAADGHLRAQRPHAGRPDLADRPADVPQRAHVLQRGDAGADRQPPALRAQPAGFPVPRQVGDAHRAHRPVPAGEPAPAGLRQGRRPAAARAPGPARWRRDRRGGARAGGRAAGRRLRGRPGGAARRRRRRGARRRERAGPRAARARDDRRRAAAARPRGLLPPGGAALRARHRVCGVANGERDRRPDGGGRRAARHRRARHAGALGRPGPRRDDRLRRRHRAAAASRRSSRPPSASWERPTRSCSPPSRSSRRPTRSCSRRTRSSRRPTRSCSRPTRSSRR